MLGKLISKTAAELLTLPIRLPGDIIEAVEKIVEPKEKKDSK